MLDLITDIHPSILVGTAVLIALYLGASFLVGRKPSPANWFWFVIAVLAIFIALGPVDEIAERRCFFMHMFQHFSQPFVIPPLLLLAVPAAVALGVIALPLIATLFHYGRFTAEDAWMTRQALVAYSAGLVGMILVKILAPGFYARQNVVTPVKIGVTTLVATQAMNLAFIGPLKHAGLALAIGLGPCLNAGLPYRYLRAHGIYRPQPGWGAFAAQVLFAAALLAPGRGGCRTRRRCSWHSWRCGRGGRRMGRWSVSRSPRRGRGSFARTARTR